jgi:hypothetical protein
MPRVSRPQPRTAPLAALDAPLDARARRRLAASLRALLAWHRTLRRWPTTLAALDAMPIVSVYAGGKLRGCFGSSDGRPHERLARAFLLAAHDGRFGGLGRADRDGAIAVLSYPHTVRALDPDRARDAIEVGTHGLLHAPAERAPTILLPQVARDAQLDAGGLLAALARKARVDGFAPGSLFTFETSDVGSHAGARDGRTPLARAGAFLERLVDPKTGAVAFAVDARTGAREPYGTMHHGRAAVVVRALERLGRRAAANRARARLERDVEAALGGLAPAAWPTRPDELAGTLALVAMAGVDVRRELARHAPSAQASPWYAAQVVAAAPDLAPRALVEACARDLEARAWAPWTAIAARAIGDRALYRRAVRGLVDAVTARAPHAGAVRVGSVPELALTAITVEALRDDARAGAAVERARGFLLRWQHDPDAPRGPVEPSVAGGGFPLSPVDDRLRCDVTAHAVLALA